MSEEKIQETENKEEVPPSTESTAAPKKEEKREWWEIPARCAVVFVIIFVFIPGFCYRAAYLYTIGRFFPHTVESRVEKIEKDVRKQLNLTELPSELRILVLRDKRIIELWGKNSKGEWSKLSYHLIMSASETPGPKCSENDGKVPEGIYEITSLDPNDIYYLAMKLNYPSAEDIAIAKQEGRDPASLGGNIVFHGMGMSKGNIMITDESMESMFYLTAKVGLKNTKVLITPIDFRDSEMPTDIESKWVLERYKNLRKELEPLTEKKDNQNAETSKN